MSRYPIGNGSAAIAIPFFVRYLGEVIPGITIVEYFYIVKAYSSSDREIAASVSPVVAYGPPVLDGDHAVSLHWSPVLGAAYYLIFKKSGDEPDAADASSPDLFYKAAFSINGLLDVSYPSATRNPDMNPGLAPRTIGAGVGSVNGLSGDINLVGGNNVYIQTSYPQGQDIQISAYPAGSNGDVQFNSQGIFGGSDNLTYLNGNLNLVGGAYQLNGVSFVQLAASGTQVNLENINFINGLPPGTGSDGGGSPVTILGSVPTSADLPASGNTTGDGWITEDTGNLWMWNGTTWISLGPAAGSGQTPWVQNVNANGFSLTGASAISVTGNISLGPASFISGGAGINLAAGGMYYVNGIPINPTTTLGDIIVRGPANIVRLGVGTNGQVLTADSTQPNGIAWENPTGGNQTPWLSNIDAAGFNLTNCPLVGNAAAQVQMNANSDLFLSSISAYIQVAAANNIFNYATQTQFFDTIGGATTQVGINTIPQYPLDVNGNVNTSGCYLIGGTTFACSNGSGGVNLSNVALINGNPPGSGGGGFWEASSTQPGSIYYDGGNVIVGSNYALADFDVNGQIRSGAPGPVAAKGQIWSWNVAYVTDPPSNTNPRIEEWVWDDYDSTYTFPWTMDAAAICLQTKSAGNVGIGTTSPFNPLTVAGGSHSVSDGSAGVAGFSLSSQTGAQTDDNLLMGVYLGNYSWIQAVKAGTASRNLLLQPNGGNIGIGTSSPNHLLHLNATGTTTQTSATPLYFQRTASILAGISVRGVVIADPCLYNPIGSDDWAIGFDPGPGIVERVRFQQDGNVGIGTSDPVTPLEVHVGTNANIGIGPQYQVSGAARIAAFSDDGSAATPMEFGASLYSFLGGDVGIGTSSPNANLDISGPEDIFHLHAANANGPYVRFYSGATNYWTIGNCLGQAPAGSWVFMDQTAARMVIAQGGNVGIGTTSPQDLLHIYSSIGWGLRIEYSGDSSYSRVSSNGIQAYTSAGGASSLYLNASGGSVSIGTSSNPGGTELNVAGDINVYRPSASNTGAIFFASSSYIFYNGSSWDFNPPLPVSGGPTTQNVVTGSRGLNTNYTNSTGKTMWVLASVNLQANTSMTIYSNGVIVAQSSSQNAASQWTTITFIVLPGAVYQVNAAGVLTYWVEWD